MSTTPLNKKIGENIESFRLQNKKNIKQMAAMLELTETGYRNIERGITEAGATKLFKIAAILNISINQLIDVRDTDKEKQSDNNTSNFVNNDNLYKLCIEQYKTENHFLKKQLVAMQELLSKTISP